MKFDPELERWLQKTNEQLRAQDVAHRTRPFDALRLYSMERQQSIDMSSDTARQIFEWFKINAPAGAHAVGSAYESVYYYDSVFWVISVPILFGTVSLDARESILAMPEPTKTALFATASRSWDYVIFWADCVDYGLGSPELRKKPGLDEFGNRLFAAADEELRAATLLLRQHRPQPRAMMNCRNATEMFFKSYLAMKGQLTDKDARTLNHDLKKGLEKFIEVSGFDLWRNAESKLSVFPEISDRYDGLIASNADLATGFAFAQSVGAVMTREFTGHNLMQQVARQHQESFTDPNI
jgi:hypothetical protein